MNAYTRKLLVLKFGKDIALEIEKHMPIPNKLPENNIKARFLNRHLKFKIYHEESCCEIPEKYESLRYNITLIRVNRRLTKLQLINFYLINKPQ